MMKVYPMRAARMNDEVDEKEDLRGLETES